jgi:hypothetical protein
VYLFYFIFQIKKYIFFVFVYLFVLVGEGSFDILDFADDPLLGGLLDHIGHVDPALIDAEPEHQFAPEILLENGLSFLFTFTFYIYNTLYPVGTRPQDQWPVSPQAQTMHQKTTPPGKRASNF